MVKAGSIATPRGAVDSLTRAEWQRVLFAGRVGRATLLQLAAPWPLRPIRVTVHRNHGFELVESASAPFLAYAGLAARFSIGPYDDSLAFADGSPSADVTILFMDPQRLLAGGAEPGEVCRFVAGRVQALRGLTDSDILVTGWPGSTGDAAGWDAALGAALDGIPGAVMCPIAPLADAAGDAWFDERAARLTGTRLSDRASVAIARVLGLRWIPGVVQPPLKAVITDLDNTLYAGVLGEDGPGGVSLTPAHRALQQALCDLATAGVLLAVCSKNDPRDVDALFAARADFPLRPEHLAVSAVGWQAKGDAVADICAALRIAPDAVVFVDDNPGEIAAVSAQHSGIRTVIADDPALATRTLELLPGLWRRRRTAADGLRADDLRAGAARETAARGVNDPRALLAALEARATFHVDSPRQVARAHELFGKTNQFNLCLQRLGEARVASLIDDPDACLVTFALADRLSDSGVIGAVAVRAAGGEAVTEEVCVSCRALGRGVEDLLVAHALRLALARLPATRLALTFRQGPRNQPALAWLGRFCGADEATIESPVSRPLAAWPWPAPSEWPVRITVEETHEPQ